MNTDVNMDNYYNQYQQDSTQIPKIRVIVRKRPINKREAQKGELDIIENKNNTVIVKESK
jgi:hypothetical protein